MFDITKSYLFYYPTPADFTAEQGVNPGEGVQSQVPGLAWTVSGNVVDYNLPPASTVTVTFVDRATGTQTTQSKSIRYGLVEFSAATAPAAWAEHTFLGWSTEEFPTYEQSQDSSFMRQPGQLMRFSASTTVYANYSTTFQGLINEGYVLFKKSDPEFNMAIKVLPNGYARKLVVDFQNVFDNDADKKISVTGLTGSWKNGTAMTATVGTAATAGNNVFMFDTTASTWSSTYWLTPAEWYDLYNNTNLKHYPCSFQFYGMDWSEYDQVTINYNQGSLTDCASRCTFGPKMPYIVNVNLLGGAQYQYMSQTFGHSSDGCGAKVINAHRANGATVTSYRTKTFNALFEGAKELKAVHGFNTAGITGFTYIFDGCRAIERIPIVDLGSAWTPSASVQQMFCNCGNLKVIEPKIMVSAVTDTYGSFFNCSALTTVHLIGINAQTNTITTTGAYHTAGITWELDQTQITQTCVNEMVDNLTTWQGFDPATGTFQKITFPSNITLTQARITLLNNNGWKAYYADGTEITAS